MTLYDSSSVVYDASTLSFDGFDPPLANMPAVGVFIAFTDGPYVADCDWTDVSYLVRQVSIRRGRQDDLQQFPAGQASVTFDNRDGYFDPFNNLSPAPFNGNLKPRKQIKIVAMWNEVEYPLFRGFVAGWPVEYTDAGLDSTVTVDCFDALGLLATEVLPADWVYDYTLSLNPAHYWRFADGQSAAFNKDEMGTLPLVYSAGSPVEEASFAQGLRSNSLYSEGVSSFIQMNTVAPADVAFAGFVRLGLYGGFGAPNVKYGYRGVDLTISTSSSRQSIDVIVETTTAGTTYQRLYVVSPPSGSVDQPIHLVVSVAYNAGTYATVFIYVNGELQTISPTSSVAGTTNTLDEFSYSYSAVQEVSVYHRQLTVDEAINLYQLAQGRIQETSFERYARIMDTIPHYTQPVFYEGDPEGVVSELTVDASLLGELQRVNQSEDGVLFIDRSGVLNFTDRYWWSRRSRSNTEQFTFSNNSSYSVDYADRTLQYFLDADRIRNETTVRFTGNGSVTVSDEASIAEYGGASENVSTVLATPDDADSLATYRVTAYKTPKLSLSPLTAQGQQDPALNWPYLLSIELLDRVGFTFAPSVGTTVSKDLLVQSVEHRFTPGTWETVVNGSTRFTGWGIWDVTLWDSSEDVWFG